MSNDVGAKIIHDKKIAQAFCLTQVGNDRSAYQKPMQDQGILNL